MESFLLNSSVKVLESGMRAQRLRIFVASQNIANAETSGKDGYRKQFVTFHDAVSSGTPLVKAVTGVDAAAVRQEYSPFHPQANSSGYVVYPDISILEENAQIRNAESSYLAALAAVKIAKQMMDSDVSLLA